jgi:peptidoglycan/xylan/chitin deacetylase (PgdA/CDA1 family)
MFKSIVGRLACLLLTASLALCLAAPAHAQDAPPFRVYFTFEDGPTDAYTPQILDILAQYNAKATFLIAGEQIKGHEDLLQREVREGHALVNHLWSEPGVYAGAPDDAVRESYFKTEAALREALGPELPRYDAQVKMFWQPGGGAKPFPATDGVHVITYAWSVNSDDCGWKLPKSIDLDTVAFDKAVIDNVLNKPLSENQRYNVYDYGDGAVVAFHDINRVTGRVLPAIIEELRSAGATFLPLPRVGDAVDTMPVKLAVPPAMGAGVPGLAMPAHTLVDARLRATPRGKIMGTIPTDTTLVATGRADGWIQVQYGDQTGWISRDLLKVLGPIPNLPQAG